jgi:hypothetical protein
MEPVELIHRDHQPVILAGYPILGDKVTVFLVNEVVAASDRRFQVAVVGKLGGQHAHGQERLPGKYSETGSGMRPPPGVKWL